MSNRPAPNTGQVAATVAGMIRQGVKPSALVFMMKMSADGRRLLDEIRGLEDPAELMRPFREDPAAWKHMENLPEAELLKFAAEFIKAAQ